MRQDAKENILTMTLTTTGATVERKALAEVLKLAAKVIERRNTIPILSCLLLTIETDRLTVSGTDLDLQLSYSIAANHAGVGAMAVDLTALKATLGKMKGANVRLSDGGGAVMLTCCDTGATVRLPSHPAKDFPHLAIIDPLDPVALPATMLRDDLARLAHSISTEETRYYLNGIYFHFAPKGCFGMASTDGHRMGQIIRDLPGTFIPGDGVILPRKAVQVLREMIGKQTGTVSLQFSRTKFRATIGQTVLVGKLIDGTFPQYERVIPTANRYKVTLSSDVLCDTAAIVTAHCTEKTRVVTLGFAADHMTAMGVSPENGVAGHVIEGIGYEGGLEFRGVGFNRTYLGTIADIFDGGDVTMSFDDPDVPVRFRSEALPGLTVVLMPMRTGDPITRDGIAKLSRTPDDVWREDTRRQVETMATIDRVAIRLLGETVGKAVRSYRDILESRGATPRQARLSTLGDIATWQGDKAKAGRCYAELALIGPPRGSFAALNAVQAPAQAISEPEPARTTPALTIVPSGPENASAGLSDAPDAPTDAEHAARVALQALGACPSGEAADWWQGREMIWRTYIGNTYGVGPDGWQVSVAKQRDRKARNRGKAVVPGMTLEALGQRFNAMIPGAQVQYPRAANDDAPDNAALLSRIADLEAQIARLQPVADAIAALAQQAA